jgi:hypothetical protein
MDPLSIIASAITIAAPVTVCLQKLRDTRLAKTDLLLLANEVAEIVLLLQELDQVLRHQSQSAESRPNPRLLQTLDAAKSKLIELSNQMSEWDNRPSSQATTAKSRPLLWIAISSKVKLFKEEFQKIRFQLMTVLSMINLWVVPDLPVQFCTASSSYLAQELHEWKW